MRLSFRSSTLMLLLVVQLLLVSALAVGTADINQPPPKQPRREAMQALDNNARAQQAVPPSSIQDIVCPTGASNTVNLTSGVDLSDVASTAGKTYYLAPGEYDLSTTINLDTASSSTCYIGQSGDSSDVLVKASTGVNVHAWLVANAAQIGLFSLVLDGQHASSGVLVVGGSAITTNDVTFQRFNNTDPTIADDNAALSFFDRGTGSISRTKFIDNTCKGCYGIFGAHGSSVRLSEVLFEGNVGTGTGFDSGAIEMFGAWLSLSGVTFRNNRGIGGDESAACIWIFTSMVDVDGPLCAFNNSVDQPGIAGCLLLGRDIQSVAQLRFNQPSTANIANNFPYDIVVADQKNLTCGSNGAPWAPGAYTVTGPVCACNEAFVNGTSTTCDSCGDLGWSDGLCACAQCEPGVGQCCTSSGAFDTTTVCRHPEPGSCKLPTVCDGTSATCPSQQPSKPDGVRCKWHPGNGRHNAAHASVTSVSAAEAAGWLTGWRKPYPSYDSDSEGEPGWPECEGTCLYGHCALKWGTPACCYVDKKHHHNHYPTDNGDGYDARPYDTAESDGDGVAAETSSAGYDSGDGKQWFCWGK